MSLRNRLLLAAAVIVAVSLLTSGTVALLLVRSLEFDNAQVELDRQALTTQQQVVRAECATVPVASSTTCPAGRITTGDVFEARVSAMVPGVADRILLLSPQNAVLYDTAKGAAFGLQIRLVRSRRVGTSTTTEGTLLLDGAPYLAAGASLGNRRNPIGANRLVLVRPTASINGLALERLLPPFLEAGLLALAVALALALILSRAIARPLTELVAASEDVAAGNYSRRVSIRGPDELGVVGRSFNRMAEAVERARTMQRDFLANVSHELKTPLTSLIGFSQALVDGSLRTVEERSRAAVIINEEAERVLRMSQELLDLARVESGQMSINPTDVDVRALLEQEVELVRPRAAKRGLELKLATPERLPPIRADQERLRQVLANLLDNAVKYADPGGPVEIAVDSGIQNVEITVANEVGKHPPDPERIFDRFYRGDPSRPSTGGVGLGLSISRELADAMGGRLWAELGGTRLRLRLTLPS